MDLEETKEVEEGRMSISRGNETSISRRTGEELKIQLSWSCRTDPKCRKNKITRPEDGVVSEMIKQLFPGRIYVITRYFQDVSWSGWRHQVVSLQQNQTRNQ